MNTGTALQEQKGVTTPREAANTFPTPARFPPRNALVRSIVTNDLAIVTAKVIPTRSSAIFVES
jgi:hypothetical protein